MIRDKFFKTFICLVLMFFSCGCAAKERLWYIAPTVIPHTERMMKSPGFWISHHPSPDQVLLDAREIDQMNSDIQNQLKLTEDIFHLDAPYRGNKLKTEIENNLENFLKQKFYTLDGRPASGKEASDFYKEIQSNLNIDEIPPKIAVRYGIVVHYADQRLFPTSQGLYAQPFDIDFDEVQNSTLDVATPVAILHQSKDGQWLYAVSSSSSGWIEIKNIAFCSREVLEKKFHPTPENRLIVTKAKADISLDQNLTQYYDYARMGCEFVIQDRINEDVVAIVLPLKKKDGNVILSTGYLAAKDIHEGYLSYTPRHTIGQAFELLNAPYGWGGMHGEQDCSAFLQEIFATVGVHLPRNSSAQAKVGKLLKEFDKNSSIAEKFEILSTQAIGGVTVLPLKGHIMLFLGMVQDRAYAIHATWGYREPVQSHDRVRVLNRVVVSDLSLGEGSRKGSLLERLLSIKLIWK